jgi:hypothetical protein
MITKLLSIPFTLIADVVTLGATINGDYWNNGNRSYTGKLLNDVKSEIEFEAELKKAIKYKKMMKRLEG